MPSRTSRVAFVAGFALVAAGCSDATAPTRDTRRDAAAPVVGAQAAGDDVVIVIFREEPGVFAGAMASLDPHAGSSGERAEALVGLSGAYLHDVSDAELAAIARDPRVAAVERAKPVTLFATSTTSWALDRLDQSSLPLSGTYDNPAGDGTGARIYVLDTGLLLGHNEFTGRAVAGADFIAGGSVAGDCQGHGTLAASAAAGRSLGTANGAQVVAVRVMNCLGQGTSTEIVRGVDWVIEQKRASPSVPMVINMSLGVQGGSTVVDEAVRRAIAAGIPVVVAAGNSNVDACGTSPARVTQAVTVGATSRTDARASFSNFGSCVDVYAPGHEVVGAAKTSTSATQIWSGTSAAAPYVAGLVAAWYARNASATPEQVHAAATNGAVTGRVTNASASPRLAQALFVGGTGGATPPPATPPTAKLTGTCVRRTCTFDASGSRDANGITSYTWDFGGQLAANSSAYSTARGTIAYAANGRYYVKVTVTNAAGLSSSVTSPVTVADAAPTARIAASCNALKRCTFSTSGSKDDGRITSVAWDLGDSTSATATSLTKTYDAYGTYTVKLTLTDDAGQTSVATTTVRLVEPIAVAALSGSCTGVACSFSAKASSSIAGIASYTFDMGDGSAVVPQSSSAKSYTYAAAGTYTVRMTVVDLAGKRDTKSMTVTVAPTPPVAKVAISCSRQVCTFDARKSSAQSGIKQYAFDFGTGAAPTVTTSPIVTVRYATTGRYTVSLVVTDQLNRTARDGGPITVR